MTEQHVEHSPPTPGIDILDQSSVPASSPGDRRRLSSVVPVRHRRKALVACGIAVLLLVGIGGIYAASSSAADQYRLASATTGDVTQSITATGSLRPISQASVTFPTSGTVAKVYVKAGQRVKPGAKLAQLDTQQLQAAVTNAEKSLAEAEANLERTEDGETTSGSAQTQTRAASSNASQNPAAASGGTPDASQLKKSIKAAQKEIDSAIAASKLSLQTATTMCASPSASTRADQPGAPAPQPEPTTNVQPTDCASAQQKVLQDQTRISQLQQQQTEQITMLNQATQAAGNQSAPTQQTETTEPTGEQIAAAQSQVNAASAGLTEARQNLRAATIVSPINGKVLDVPYSKGDQATTSQAIVISGSTQYQATVQIAVDKIGSISAGQTAHVQPSGSTTIIEGTVATIGVASVSSDSAVTYPVTINLANNPSELRSGTSANVEIVTASETGVLTIPTSAVTSLGTLKTVTVMRDGNPQTVTVTVGAVGAARTEVVEGLRDGDQVVLADLAEPLPTGNTATLRLPGGFGSGGGNFPAGGPPGLS